MAFEPSPTAAGRVIWTTGTRPDVLEDASNRPRNQVDASAGHQGRLCLLCGASLDGQRLDAIYCGPPCRKRAHRFRGRFGGIYAPGHADPGLLFAYADPPYIDRASLYADQPTYDGEVDHVQLIAQLHDALQRGAIHGWAISCSTKSLRVLLPLCPDGIKVCTWTKPAFVLPGTLGIACATEAVLIMGGRPVSRGVVDHLHAAPARGGRHDLIGRKPHAFCAWLFDLLGMVPGDHLFDLFPGTETVGRAWEDASRRHPGRHATYGRPAFLQSTRPTCSQDASPVHAGRVADPDGTEITDQGDLNT